MPDIYVLGGVNMDYVVSLPQLPDAGETIKGNNLLVNPGGKGGNQAVGCAKLGASVYMVGNVGKDNAGDELLSVLSNYGVKTDYLGQLDSQHTGTALIFVDPDGENMIGFAPGATTATTKDDIDKALAEADDDDVFLTGFEPPINIVKYAIREASNKDMRVIVNPAPAQALPEEIYSFIDVFTPNQSEASTLLGKEINGVEDALSMGSMFNDKGVSTSIITLGEEGCGVISQETKEHFVNRVPEDKVVDTTAAGDSFNAAIAVSLARGKGIGEAANFANKAASITTTEHGAQSALPTNDEVKSERE